MKDRETWVTSTFIELTDTLVSDFDLADFMATLVARCGELLEATDIGIVLVDAHGALRVLASSTEQLRALELLEIQNDEGPCLDCVRTGQPVGPVRLDTEGRTRWPGMVATAIAAGYGSVVALPMRLRQQVLGAVNIFLTGDHEIPARDLRLAQALADAATISILQERTLQSATQLAEQLQAALTTRVAIEQAKGMLAEAHGVTVDRAFLMLRAYARNHNLRIGEVAGAIGQRRIGTDEIPPVSD